MKSITLSYRPDDKTPRPRGSEKNIVLHLADDGIVTADLIEPHVKAWRGWSGEELCNIGRIVSGMMAAEVIHVEQGPFAWLHNCVCQAGLTGISSFNRNESSIRTNDPDWHRKLAEFCKTRFSRIDLD